MQIATKTLEAIEVAMANDQGATNRGLLRPLMAKAEDAYSTDNTPFRNHLGASLIGRECARELWYSFHWVTLKQFDARMLRLFNTGHLMEPKIVASLEMIGCKVYQFDGNGKQFRIVGHRKHFGGSCDAVVVGIPDLPAGQAALAEFKSHGEKSFVKLKAAGLVAAKFEHYVQMLIYMSYFQLDYGLYVAQNKNTDEIYSEIIQFNSDTAKRYFDRSAMIIDSIEPPPRIGKTPGHFGCKFCDHIGACHRVGEYQIHRNCRTCSFSKVEDEGAWSCESFGTLSSSQQRLGCEHYQLNPKI